MGGQPHWTSKCTAIAIEEEIWEKSTDICLLGFRLFTLFLFTPEECDVAFSKFYLKRLTEYDVTVEDNILKQPELGHQKSLLTVELEEQRYS